MLFLLDKIGINLEVDSTSPFPLFVKCNFKRFNTGYSITLHSHTLFSGALNIAVTAVEATGYTIGTEMLTHINTLTP